MKQAAFAFCAVLAFAGTSNPTNAAASIRYVWQDSPSPGPPYADWTTAAHTIQDAVDAAGERAIPCWSQMGFMPPGDGRSWGS
jgi:hypothetical protein